MKARINIRDKITKKQKADLKEYILSIQFDLMRRFFKLMCISLNEQCNFGKKRLLRLIGQINRISTEHADDEIFWEHIDKRVIEQMGMQFDYEKYEEIGKSNE